MRQCDYVNMWLRDYATMRLCEYVTVWLCDYATMWLCYCVTMWLCECYCVTMWLCYCVTMWLCDYVTVWLLLYDYVTVWLSDHATVWLSDYVTSWLCDCYCVTMWLCDLVTDINNVSETLVLTHYWSVQAPGKILAQLLLSLTPSSLSCPTTLQYVCWRHVSAIDGVFRWRTASCKWPHSWFAITFYTYIPLSSGL